MTENNSSVFPQDLQEINLADQPKPIEQVIQSLNRQPRWQLIEIGEGLANVASLLHVAYKSAAFEDGDYQEEIFDKSIGSGGDQVLLQRILDEVAVCHKKVNSLRLQLVEGDE